MSDALTKIRTRNVVTPQSEQAKPNQVKNLAGGFVFQVTPEARIRRFLILGTTGGTYYQGEQELTKENTDVVIDWATNRTRELVDIVLEISEAGRAPKQNPTIFALAAAAGLGDDAGRAYALSVLPRVARIGTQLFLFAKYVEQFRGWGRGLRKAVGNWYESKEANQLAYQMVKYRQREGWTHRDLLRLTHPYGTTQAHKGLYDWVTKGNSAEAQQLPTVMGYLEALEATTAKEWVRVVEKYKLSWEMLPDAALTEKSVWDALIANGLPMGALIRQLPRLTRLDVLKGASLKTVLAQLSSQEALRKARIHPVNVLVAQKTYASGRSFKGSSVWTPNTKIVDALDGAFYKSFANVEPANKRTFNALDVSGSMGMPFGEGVLTSRDVTAAMSLVTVSTEPEVFSAGFTGGGYWRDGDSLTPLSISSRQRLDDVVKTISGLPFGSTDCAQPMLYALKNSMEIDTFLVSTDNDTWAGTIHSHQALEQYRRESGINARLIVLATTASNFSIADPNDALSLDIVGFDSAVPNLISDFSAGRI